MDPSWVPRPRLLPKLVEGQVGRLQGVPEAKATTLVRVKLMFQPTREPRLKGFSESGGGKMFMNDVYIVS